MFVEEKKRKVRSDKKRDIKPTVPIALKECVERLSYIFNIPVKDVTETICLAGLESKKVIDLLSTSFRRDYRHDSTLYKGNLSRPSLQKEKILGLKDRITTRFSSDIYEKVNQLAYALDVTPTRATAMLLDASIRNTDYVNEFVKNHMESHLNPKKMKELNEVLTFINTNNPYDEKVSMSMLISYLVDELKIGVSQIGTSLSIWFDKVKK